MPDYKQIQDIARSSLMADFFAVRIDEEGLFDDMKAMFAAMKLPTPLPALDRIKVIAANATDANTFIDGIKDGDLFTPMRDLLMKVNIG